MAANGGLKVSAAAVSPQARQRVPQTASTAPESSTSSKVCGLELIKKQRRAARKAFKKEQYKTAVQLYSEAIKETATLALAPPADGAADDGASSFVQRRFLFSVCPTRRKSQLNSLFSLRVHQAVRIAQKNDYDTDQHSRLLLGRASGWLSVGEYRKAVNDADAALMLSPRSPRAYAKRGQGLLKLNAYKEASEAFLAGMEHSPTDGELKKGFAASLRGLRTHRLVLLCSLLRYDPLSHLLC